MTASFLARRNLTSLYIGNTVPTATEQSVFVSARLNQCRLIEEKLVSAPSQPSTERREMQVRVETASNFGIAIKDPAAPDEFQVELNYKVALRLLSTEKVLAEYEAEHAAQFTILASHGISDWTNVPQLALQPYFAMILELSVRRAECTFLEMGMRGVALPKGNEAFDGLPVSVSRVDDTASETTTSG